MSLALAGLFVGGGCSDDGAADGVEGTTIVSGSETGSETGAGAGLCADDPAELTRPEGWGVLSHCKGAEPDYERSFADGVVHRINIVIAAEDLAAMSAKLDDLLAGMGGPPGPDTIEDRMYVPSTVALDGVTWWQVGMRFKGNSSLRSVYMQGIQKYDFRLDFDEYEIDNHELLDQRSWGSRR